MIGVKQFICIGGGLFLLFDLFIERHLGKRLVQWVGKSGDRCEAVYFHWGRTVSLVWSIY